MPDPIPGFRFGVGERDRQGPSPTELFVWRSWMGVSEGRSALCYQPERQGRAGNTRFGASCQAMQKLHNLISDGNRWPLFSQSQEPHGFVSPSFCAPGRLHWDAGKLLCIPQSPLPDLSKCHLPPPARTSTRDDVIFLPCLALLCSLLAPPRRRIVLSLGVAVSIT